MDVLKTTSPVVLPLAPIDRPWNTVPSARANTALTLTHRPPLVVWRLGIVLAFLRFSRCGCTKREEFLWNALPPCADKPATGCNGFGRNSKVQTCFCPCELGPF